MRKEHHHAEETQSPVAAGAHVSDMRGGADVHRDDGGTGHHEGDRRGMDADERRDLRAERSRGLLLRLRTAAEAGPVGRPLTAEPFHGPLPFKDVVYRGRRNAAGDGLATVDVRGVTRRIRCQDQRLEWASVSEATERLAKAILVDFLGFIPSRMLVEAFTIYALARLDYFGWELRPEHIRNALRAIGRDSGITCLRCLDLRVLQFNQEGDEFGDEIGSDDVVAREEPCPVCRWQERQPAPLTVENL